MEEYKISLGAILDANAKGDLQQSINAIRDLKVKISKAELNSKAIADIKKQLEQNGIDLKVVFGNTNQVINQAKQMGQQVGAQINNGLAQSMNGSNTVIDRFRQSLSNMGMDSRAIDTVVGRLKNLDVQVDSLNQKISTSFNGKNKGENILSVAVAGVDKMGNAVKIVDQFNITTGEYLKTLSEVASAQQKAGTSSNNYVAKQKAAIASLQNQINQINRAANDKNSARPIGETNLEALKGKYEQINAEIGKMSGLSGKAFSDQQNKIKSLISDFKSLVSEYRNADNVSSKLKGSSIDTGKNVAAQDLKKLNADAKEYSDKMKSTLESLKSAFSNISDTASLNAFTDKMREARAELAKLKAEATAGNREEKVGINVSGFQSKIDDLKRISPEIKNFKTQINGADVTIESLAADLEKVKTQGDVSVLNTKWRAFTEAAKAAGIAIKETATSSTQLSQKMTELANKAKFSVDSGNGASEYQNRIIALEQGLKKYGLSADEAQAKTAKLKELLSGFKTTNGDWLPDEEIVAQAKRIEREFESVKTYVDKAKLSFEKFSQPVSDVKAVTLINRINSFLQKNTKITKDARIELEGFVNELNRGGVTESRWNQMNVALKKTEDSMRGLGKLGASFRTQMGQAASTLSSFASVATLVSRAVSKTREALSELKEVDTYLTEISKTNDSLTKSQLENIGNNSFETASKYGKKATDYLAGVQEMSRAGYENAEAMGELSIKAQGAGDMTEEVTNKFIVAADKAYKLNGSLTSLTSVMDGINNITNHNAVNMTELSEGFSIVGSTAASFGVEANELAAALGTMTASTRQSGSEVARAFRAILLNIRQVSDAEEGIDTEGLTKYEEACNALGVKLKETKNGVMELRDPMEVLEELSKKYNELSDTDINKVNLLNSVGGKLRSTQLDALLRGWSDYKKMLGEFADGAGSMDEEAEKTSKSLEGSLNRLSNTWTDTVNNIANSDLVTGIVNKLDDVLSVINKITDALGSVGSLSVIGGLVGGVKGFKSLKSSIGTVSPIIDALSPLGSGASFGTAEIDSYVESLKGLTAAQQDVVIATTLSDDVRRQSVLTALQESQVSKTLTADQYARVLATQMGNKEDAMALLQKAGLITAEQAQANSTVTVTKRQVEQAVSAEALKAEEGDLILASLGLTGANTGQAGSWGLLTKAIWANIKAMWVWLTTNPMGWLVLAAGATVALIGVVDLFTTTIEENNEKIEEATTKIDEYQKAIDEVNDKEKAATDTYKEYMSLMSKSNAYGLQAEEQKKLVSLSKELVDTYGLQIEGIDSVTGAYIIGTDAINSYVEALRAERAEKERAQSDERDKRVDANIDNLKKYKKDYDAYKATNERTAEAEKILADLENEYLDVQDIINEYSQKLNKSDLSQDARAGINLSFGNALHERLEELGVKDSWDVASRIRSAVSDNVRENISASEMAKLKSKMSNVVNSVVKDVLADIRVDNYDMLDEKGESLLTQLLTPYLTDVDWDSFDKDDFEEKVKGFIQEHAQTLSKVSTELEQSQTAASGGTLDMSGYETFYKQLGEKLSILNQMYEEGVITQEAYQQQYAQTQADVANDIGLSMASIMSKFGPAEESAKQSFSAIANQFISLENQFRNGSINSIQYLDQLNDAIDNMDVAETFGNNEAAIGEFFGTLAAKSTNVMSDTLTQFEAGKISVSEYGDRLAKWGQQQREMAEAAAEAAKANADSKEEIDAINKTLEEQNKVIDDTVKKWEDFKGINEYLDENAASLNSFTSTASDGYASYVDGLYNEFMSLSDEDKNAIIKNMNELDGSLGVTTDNLHDKMMSSLGATKTLTQAVCSETNGVFKDLVTAGADVLDALGAAIGSFDYSIKFEIDNTPQKAEFKVGPVPISIEIPSGININGEAGEAGKQLGAALRSSAEKFKAIPKLLSPEDFGKSFQNQNNGGGKSATPPSGGSGGGKSSGSKKSGSDDAKKKQEEAQKKELEQLKAGLEMRKSLLEKYKEAVDLTDFGLDLAEENDFALRTDLLNSKMAQLTSYGQAMRKEFDRVAKIIPKTGEQADALASHLKSLGSDMRSNITDLRKTQVAMQQLKIDSITSVSDYYMKDLESELSNITKRMDLLNKDNKEDYEYTNQILQTQAMLPMRSDSVGARNNRRNSDKDIIKSQEATQDTLTDMLKTQIEKNEDLREDERQALLADMETMRQDLVIKLEESQQDYSVHTETVKGMTDEFTQYITNTVNNMDLEIPEPDATRFTDAANKIKNSLKEIGVMIEGTPGAYASGTPGGNAQASHLGIAGENFKPEVLIDKKTGKATYIDSPTLIDTRKTDVVGEKRTSELPQFADGTFDTEKMYKGLDSVTKNIKGYGAVKEARSYLGVPYVWGGTSRDGVDCSGLTYLAWTAMGVNLGRTTYDQYPNTARVSQGQLKPGDLVFSRFGADGKEGPGHVGMYIGKGNTIEAPSTGDVVKISPLGKWTDYGHPTYAKGTPKGNKKASKLGVAGENFKPEILIDKSTGAMRVIACPTVIDVSKTDVVGEKQTKNLPKFATGTVDPMDIAAYIRQKYPEITNAGIAAILGNIQQESSFDPKAKTIEAYGSGSSKPTARWGLFQLDDTRISNWSNIVQNGTWQQQIDTALAEGRYANSGMGNSKAHNVWANVLTNTSYDAATAAREFDRLYERSDGKSRETRAANAQKYLNQITNNTDALTSNTEALKEVDPNKQKVENIQSFVNGTAEEIKKAVRASNIESVRIGNDESLSDREKQYALFDIYGPTAKEAARIGKKSYDELHKQFLEYAEKVDSGELEFSSEVWDGFIDGLSDIADKIYDYEENLSDTRDKIVSYMEEDIQKIDDYIDDRDFYGDWRFYGDSKLNSILRKIDTVQEQFDAGRITETQYNVYIRDYRKEYKDAQNEELEKLLSDKDQYIEDREFYDDWGLYGDSKTKVIKRELKDVAQAYEDGALSVDEYNDKVKELSKNLYSAYQEELTNNLNLQLSKIGSMKTVLQKQFDTENSIAAAQHEINKELEKSKTMYEWLDEDTRKLLFNQEDYNELSEELVSIQSKSNKLLKQYNNEISGATAEEIDGISSKYQAQYDILMKSYEIKKADLEILKKQQQLNNVLKERNVRMFVDGRWQWVANTQDVINAKEELADAEYQRTQSETSLSQTQEMGQLTAAEATLNTAVNKASKSISDFKLSTDDMVSSITDLKVKGVSAFSSALKESALSIKGFVQDIESSKIQTGISTSKYLDFSAEMTGGEYTNKGRLYLNNEREKVVDDIDSHPLIDPSSRNPIGDARDGQNYMSSIITDMNDGNISNALKTNENRNIKIDTDNSDEYKYSAGEIQEIYEDGFLTFILKAIEDGEIEKAVAANEARNEKIDLLKLNVPKWSEETIRAIADGGFLQAILEALSDGNLELAFDINRLRNEKIDLLGLSEHKYNDDELMDLLMELSKNNGLQIILNAIIEGDVEKALAFNQRRNKTVNRLGSDEHQYRDGEIELMYKAVPKKKIEAHAKGTSNAKSGLSLVGETEPEVLVTRQGNLIPVSNPTLLKMQGGEMVFNSSQLKGARELWNIANSFGGDFGYGLKNHTQTIDNSNCNNVYINGMRVDNGSQNGRELIDALKRYTGNH